MRCRILRVCSVIPLNGCRDRGVGPQGSPEGDVFPNRQTEHAARCKSSERQACLSVRSSKPLRFGLTGQCASHCARVRCGGIGLSASAAVLIAGMEWNGRKDRHDGRGDSDVPRPDDRLRLRPNAAPHWKHCRYRGKRLGGPCIPGLRREIALRPLGYRLPKELRDRAVHEIRRFRQAWSGQGCNQGGGRRGKACAALDNGKKVAGNVGVHGGRSGKSHLDRSGGALVDAKIGGEEATVAKLGTPILALPPVAVMRRGGQRDRLSDQL